MIEKIKTKYPKTCTQLVEAIKSEEVMVNTPVTLWGVKYRTDTKWVGVKPNTQEFSSFVKEYTENIKEPIWSLCEALLNHEYSDFKKGGDTNTITIAETDFVFGFNGWDKHSLLSPRIDANTYENKLLERALYEVVHWETVGKIRQELKDKLCGGDNEL